MIKKRVIGLMSGSSLDGLDVAVCEFQFITDGLAIQIQDWKLMEAATIPLGHHWQKTLENLHHAPSTKLLEMHSAFGNWCGEQASKFCEENNVKCSFAGSHGHTIFHEPDQSFSFQLGHGSAMARHLGLPVVFDFRMQDIVMGGQGAPMIPIAEKYLWSEYSGFINLGGIANISLHQEDHVLAWDSCGCNQLLNFLTRSIDLEYDRDGEIASGGKLHDKLFETLISEPWYDKSPPKSLSNQWVKNNVISLLGGKEISLADKLHTTVHAVAHIIAEDIAKQAIGGKINFLCTGGGSKNTFLIKTIAEQLSKRGEYELTIPDPHIIDFKEAIMIAFTALLRMYDLPNFIPSATGAQKAVSGGVISL
jgi:anhydro-N-acetylmuramic acid kinase